MHFYKGFLGNFLVFFLTLVKKYWKTINENLILILQEEKNIFYWKKLTWILILIYGMNCNFLPDSLFIAIKILIFKLLIFEPILSNSFSRSSFCQSNSFYLLQVESVVQLFCLNFGYPSLLRRCLYIF